MKQKLDMTEANRQDSIRESKTGDKEKPKLEDCTKIYWDLCIDDDWIFHQQVSYIKNNVCQYTRIQKWRVWWKWAPNLLIKTD